MTTEQEKAIERLTNGEKIDFNTLIRKFKEEGIENFVVTKREYIDTVLNMLKEQDKYIKDANDITTEMSNDIKKLTSEIEKKDKQIDLMAEYIDGDDTSLANYLYKENGKCNKEMIKQYFERKVEKE